jgi:hypothetical protein
MSMRRRALVSILVGFILSVVLFLPVHWLRLPAWFYLPQMPGFIVSAHIWGAHGDGRNQFWVVMIAVNFAFYCLAAFGLMSIAVRAKDSGSTS